jgi:nitrite reductase/ring-hydroxylating ferredoxin subunit
VRLTDGAVEPPERGCVRTFEVMVDAGAVKVKL